MNVLDIGPGIEGTGFISKPEMYWPICQVYTMDVDTGNKPYYTHDIAKPVDVNLHNQFDAVHASHVLEHIDRTKVVQAAQNIHDLLKPGGEAVILVPCLEFACNMILSGRNTIGVQGLLYGGCKNEYDVHRTAFTMASLKVLFEKVGMRVVKSETVAFISSVNGEEETMYSNKVVVAK